MRAAIALALLLAASLSGCLGIDNMAEFKAALGFQPLPAEVLPPIARLRASPTLAAVGQPVAFSAQGSLDPQAAPLAFAWDFGDGTRASGSEASHRYAAPGTYTTTLRATSALGLAGEDRVLLTVVENRAPVADFRVRAGEAEVERALAGQELTFEALARDPEGQPLALRWDFGDGAGALTPEARHAYARGGRYVVALHAEDPSGLAGTATRVLAVDQDFGGRGEVAAVLDETAAHALEVAPEVQRILVAVQFDAGLGLNALRVLVADAQGDVVKELTVHPAPATQGQATGALELTAQDLAGRPAGEWTLVVQRASGLRVPYAFTAEVRY